MSEKRRIVSNTLANGIAQFTAILSSLIFMPILIREFGRADYGLLLLASSIAAYASIVDFGVGVSLVKNVAELSSTDDREGLGKYISTSLLFYVVVGILVALVLAVIAFSTSTIFNVTADNARLLRNMLLVVAIASLWTWPASTGGLVLGGLQRHTLSAATSVAAAIANVGVILAVLAANQGPFALLIGQSIVGALAGVANVIMARRAIRNVRVHPSEADITVLRDIASFSWVIFVLQVCTVIIYQQTDRVILGVFLGASAITLYESAGKMQGLVTQLTQFATSAVMPFATQLSAEGRHSALQTLYFRGTKYVMALVLPVVTTLMILAKPIISAWLGPDFAAQSLAAQVLLSYQLLGPGAVVGEHILASRGNAKKRLFNSVFVVTLGNVVLSITLVRHIGILGVVVGTAVPWIIDFPARLHVTLREVDASFRDWVRRSSGPVYLSLVATCLVAGASYLTPLVESLPGLAVAGCASVAASWLGLLLFGLSPVEKDELRRITARITGRAT